MILNSFNRARFLTVAAVFATFASSGISRAAYDYISVDDNTGPNSQPQNVAINGNGNVLIEWLLDSGSNSIDKYTAGVKTNVAFGGSSSVSPYFNVAYAGLNSTGQVSFLGTSYVPLTNQIFRDTAGTKQTISQLPNVNTDSFGNGTSINDTGDVAFRRTFGGVTSIQRSNGVTSTTIVQVGQNNVSSLLDPTVNNLGQVAVRANYSTGNSAMWRGNGVTTTTIADISGALSAIGPTPAGINNLGDVAFNAEFDAGGEAVFIGNGTTLTPVADTSGAFDNLSWISINDLDQVAFLATLDAGGGGIFTGSNPATDKVIASGDSLFGSTVTSVVLFNDGLNASGQVAFRYQLANGIRGVAVATPSVPEPTAAVCIVLASIGFLSRRHRG